MSAQSFLGEYTGTKLPDEIEFEDLIIGSLPLNRARPFFRKHHYSGGCGNAAMCWGLRHNPTGILIGAIAFQTPISENARASIFEQTSTAYDNELVASWNQCDCDHIDETHGYREHVTELHRMAIVDDAPHNTATWFISRALKRLKEYKPKYWAVISMADSTEGHDGTVYQAANADYYGMSKRRKCYVDADGRLRNKRQCGVNISVDEAQERGWETVQRETKHRYVFWLPDPYDSKDQLRQMASIELQDYPEETTQQ